MNELMIILFEKFSNLIFFKDMLICQSVTLLCIDNLRPNSFILLISRNRDWNKNWYIIQPCIEHYRNIFVILIYS